MSKSRGKRHDDLGPRKLNMKKVFATVIAIVVIIMIFISLKNLLTDDSKKDISSLTSYISVFENNKWGVIDNKGNKIIDTSYDEMIVIPDENKDIFICPYDINYDNETYKTKVLNKDGKEIFTNYQNIKAIENTDGSDVWYENNVLIYMQDGKYGLVDFDGKVLVNAEYDNIYSLQGIENSIIIEKDGKKGLINCATGQIIIDAIYADIMAVSESYENGYIVKNAENKFGIILPDKKEVLEEKYDDIKKVAGNNYYVVVENGTLEIINKSGKVILNSGFDSVEKIQVDKFIITLNGLYGVIDNKGNNVIPAEYQDLKFATSKTLIAKKNEKYGIISENRR